MKKVIEIYYTLQTELLQAVEDMPTANLNRLNGEVIKAISKDDTKATITRIFNGTV